MPARSDYRLCSCNECQSDNSIGVWFDRPNYAAHQVRIVFANPIDTSPEDEIAHSRAVSLAMTDPGPDLSCSSRLWSSRSDHQDAVMSSIQPHGPLPFNEILSTVQQVLGGDLAPPHADADNPSPMEDPSPIPPKRIPHLTTQSLNILHNIEGRILQLHTNIEQPRSAQEFEQYLKELGELRARVEKVNRKDDILTTTRARLLDELERLLHHCTDRLDWARADIDPDAHPVEINTEHLFQSPIDDASEALQVSLFLVVFCCVIAGVSRRIGDFMLGVISIIFALVLKGQAVTSIPTSVRTALNQFNLDDQTTVYAVCPACHCTYEPRTSSGSPIYPPRCNNQPRPGLGTCGQNLLERLPNSTLHLRKVFVYHHFHDYLARLLTRPDIENVMDVRCDQLRDSVAAMDLDPDSFCTDHELQQFVKDIFEASFLKAFPGPSGTKLFMDRPGTEGRYAFTLNLDFFAPEGMSVRGAKVSVGLLSMACLNLPLDIRYKPENMYIAGVIPGPHEPSLTQLNHYIRPLIEDFRISWTRGIHFSRTALLPRGRKTHSAIITCVCDLPAARKLSQMAPARSHHYCSVCHCWKLQTIGRTDHNHEDWTPRNPDELRQFAEQWKSSPTLADQKTLFSEHGVRWSEMWKLPYWDPARQLVVDSMHCLLEGLVHHHVRRVLGLTVQHSGSSLPAFTHIFQTCHDGASLALNKRELKQIPQIHHLLTAAIAPDQDHDPDDMVTDDLESQDSDTASLTSTGTTDDEINGIDGFIDGFSHLRRKLLTKNRKALLFVCQGEMPTMTDLNASKGQLADALLEWVGDHSMHTPHTLIFTPAQDQALDTSHSTMATCYT
jgi:hypothetical protein